MDEDMVTITVKDYKDKSKTKPLVLNGEEFIYRFLMHVPAKGLCKNQILWNFGKSKQTNQTGIVSQTNLKSILQAKICRS
jgi:hypothetical protein